MLSAAREPATERCTQTHCSAGASERAAQAIRACSVIAHSAEMQQLCAAIESYRASPRREQDLEPIAEAALALLQHGLNGNRAVAPHVWAVVSACVRAFPIQLGASVDRAEALAAAAAAAGASAGGDLATPWLAQAAADGSLAVLLQRLRTQPQIATAYAHDAPVRDAGAVEQLVAQLQVLQELVPVTPYDSLLQQQKQPPAAAAATAATAAAAPAAACIHIETEDDLPRHNHNQQQQRGPAGMAAAGSAAIANGPSGHGASAPQQQGAAAAAAAAEPAPAKQRLYGRMSSKALALPSFSKGAAAAAAAGSKGGIAAASRAGSKHGSTLMRRCGSQQAAAAEQQLLSVQLLVVQSAGAARVQLQLQPLPHPATGAGGGGLLGAGAGAVRGLLAGLQQSASAGLQQSAAAGQELTGAMAAAGGAMAAAMSSAVATRAGNKAGRAAAATAAKAAADKGASSGAAGEQQQQQQQQRARRMPSLFNKRQQAPAAAAADTSPSDAAVDGEPQQLLQVQLLVCGDAARPVALCIAAVDEQVASEAGSTDGAAASGSRPRWGLLNRISMGRSTSSSRDGQQSGNGGSGAGGNAAARGQASEAATLPAPAAAAAAAAAAADRDLLEGDMWSVMARLKGAGTVIAANASAAAAAARQASGAAAAGGGPLSPTAAAAAEAAAAAQLQQAGAALLQQLLASCGRVCAAAAATRGCLGEDSPELLQLVALLQELLNHGLRGAAAPPAPAAAAAAPAAAGAGAGAAAAAAAAAGISTAREVLGGWLPGKAWTAFGVLQALQHGSKAQPRLMLGADGIANMKAAKAAPPAARLQLWVRASLNEQLLGCRLATLAANPAALAAWYQPQALLLQQAALQPLLQQLAAVSCHKFALPVEGPGVGAAAGGGSAAGAMDPWRLLGGITAGLGARGRAGGGAAAARQQGAPAAVAAGGSSSSIPAFSWGAADAAQQQQQQQQQQGGAAAGGGGLFKRRRHVAPISDVRLPPPDSALVLSPTQSCALSPVSTAGDAAFAEWWSPTSSWNDFGGGAGSDSGAQQQAAAGSATGSRCASGELQAAAGSGDAGPAWQSARSRTASNASGSSVGEAAQRLEAELAAAMSSTLSGLQRGGGGGTCSSSGGGGSSSGSGSGRELRRSSSTGFDAAVARARAGRPGGGASAGLHHGQHDGGGAVGRRRHGHKRSSSTNDLPELAALLEGEQQP